MLVLSFIILLMWLIISAFIVQITIPFYEESSLITRIVVILTLIIFTPVITICTCVDAFLDLLMPEEAFRMKYQIDDEEWEDDNSDS